jgi:hypothetical protein
MLKKLFVVASAAMLAASCIGEGNNERPTVETAWVSFGVATAQTRGGEEATDEEKKINNVNFVVVDAEGEIEKSIYVSAYDGTQSVVEQLTTGPKKFYAVVNCGENLFYDKVGQEFAAGGMAEQVTDGMSEANKMWMTNVGEPVSQLIVPTESAAEADVKNPVAIEVGRLLAKMTVTWNDALNIEEVWLESVPDKTYLFPVDGGRRSYYRDDTMPAYVPTAVTKGAVYYIPEHTSADPTENATRLRFKTAGGDEYLLRINDKELSAPERYGVLRNHHYRVDVTDLDKLDKQ